MRKILFLILLFCITITASGATTLHVKRIQQDNNEYYELSTPDDTIYISSYVYTRGIKAYYREIKTTTVTYLQDEIQKLKQNDNIDLKYIETIYNKLICSFNEYNPDTYVYNGRFISFYKIGHINNQIEKLIKKIHNI